MYKYFPFLKYQKDKCDECIRSVECNKTENAIILCAVQGFFKTGEEAHWTKEDAEELELAPKRGRPYPRVWLG